MRQSLGVIAQVVSGGRADIRSLAWEKLRYQHTQAIRTALAEKYGAGTTNKMLAALRGVLKEAWRLGLMSAESYHRAVDLKAIKSETLPRGRSLSSGELRALFEACAEGTKAGVRDAAMLSVLYAGGLRRSEAVGLDLSDYLPETGALTVRGGKGRKDRIVYASNGSADALADWISLRGDEDGALFCPVNKGNRIAFRRMTDQAVLGIVRKRGEEAGVARFSPHDLRRTFVSDLLDAGADLSTTKRLAGHSSEATTGRVTTGVARRRRRGRRSYFMCRMSAKETSSATPITLLPLIPIRQRVQGKKRRPLLGPRMNERSQALIIR
jgi:integrase